MFNKHLGEMKNIQSIINNAIIEMKSTLEGTNSRVTETEDKIEVEEPWVGFPCSRPRGDITALRGPCPWVTLPSSSVC